LVLLLNVHGKKQQSFSITESGFASAGIFLFNENIVDDNEFLAATVSSPVE